MSGPPKNVTYEICLDPHQRSLPVRPRSDHTGPTRRPFSLRSLAPLGIADCCRPLAGDAVAIDLGWRAGGLEEIVARPTWLLWLLVVVVLACIVSLLFFPKVTVVLAVAALVISGAALISRKDL